jgi:hypothetical protein
MKTRKTTRNSKLTNFKSLNVKLQEINAMSFNHAGGSLREKNLKKEEKLVKIHQMFEDQTLQRLSSMIQNEKKREKVRKKVQERIIVSQKQPDKTKFSILKESPKRR